MDNGLEQKYIAIREEFRSESDRGCAVLVICALEEALQSCIRKLIFDPDDKAALRQLAPPGAMRAAITNARSLGLLDEEEAKNFLALTQVRNKFAHHPLVRLSFESPEITKEMKDLTTFVKPPFLAPALKSNRERFLWAADMLYGRMQMRYQFIQRSSPIDDLNKRWREHLSTISPMPPDARGNQ